MAKPSRASRDAPFSVRLSGAERAELERRAEAAGLSLGAFFKAAALGAHPPRRSRRRPADHQVLARLMGEIGRIGNNVNQLARASNAGSWPDTTSLAQAAADIAWMRIKILQALGAQAPGEETGDGPRKDGDQP